MEYIQNYYLVPIGGCFELWFGYVESESNFHYQKFSGFQPNGSELWILWSTEVPERAVPIESWRAIEMIKFSREVNMVKA